MHRAATLPQGHDKTGVHWSASLQVEPGELRAALKEGWLKGAKLEGWVVDVHPRTGRVDFQKKKNLVVDEGVKTSLDRLFSINGPPAALTRIGVDNGTTNPTATSTSSDAGGGADTGSSSQTLRTFDSTPTRSGKVVTCIGTFNDATTGGIGAVGFTMKRLFLSRHTANITNTTSADAATTLYSMTNVFTIDLSVFSTWTQVFTATITGTGS